MKRVVFFLGTTLSGGAEHVVCHLANRFVEDGYSVRILQYYSSECHYKLDVRVVRESVPEVSQSRSAFGKLGAIRKYVKENADVVISFMTPTNVLMLLATLGMRIPVIVSERNDPRFIPQERLQRFLRKTLYPVASYIVCQTEMCKRFFGKRLEKKCCVIFNPMDVGENVGRALKATKKNEIVSVGRLIPAKNQKMLLNSFARFHEKHPEYVLKIYGYGSLTDELKRYAGEIGLSDCVLFEGVVKDVAEHICGAKMFVLSSNYEGMPNALLEAMCFGLPVISTKVSGATDLVDENNGILVDIGDEDQLFHAMETLEADEERRIRLATNATKIAELLKMDRIVPQWEALVEKVTEK